MENKRLNVLLAFVLLVALQSCGEEIARLPINQLASEADPAAQEVTLDLQEGDEVFFWSDMELEYEGDLTLRFHVHINKNGGNYKSLEINPFEKSLTVGEVKTSIGDQTSWSFTGKNSHIKIEEDASYTFRSYLIASESDNLKLHKAELVLKK
ncbi:MAG: hypothetical protein ACPGJS_16340 [Flammeovirgaceae bacterium]